MIRDLTLHGGTASLLWGYRTAAVLKSWRITKDKKQGKWTLTGTLARVDAFQARQTPLIFTAPRDKGMWCWPIESIDMGPNHLRAILGPPEQ